MDSAKFHDDLWEEIPDYAYMALGRRGREKIMLHECFHPGCKEKDDTKLHPIEKTETLEKLPEKTISGTSNPNAILLRKYTIYCDQGKHAFQLVFERHGRLSEEQTLEEEDVMLERVYATNESGQKNYGEIGYVQFR